MYIIRIKPHNGSIGVIGSIGVQQVDAGDVAKSCVSSLVCICSHQHVTGVRWAGVRRQDGAVRLHAHWLREHSRRKRCE